MPSHEDEVRDKYENVTSDLSEMILGSLEMNVVTL